MHTNIASKTAVFWVITQRLAIIPYRRFGTTCWPHYTLRNNPEERSTHLLHGGSQKSNICLVLTWSEGGSRPARTSDVLVQAFVPQLSENSTSVLKHVWALILLMNGILFY